ncbi:arginase family protein [Actinocorallia sp. API 0066]|uniref:arginase family protein n=1 Tax=Actinocorallia sp. API 0066 TaxID=2896846 RepID=UPI001E3B5288|nr:arginase family protein [Actinocorallia sp. API 0066]MCD0451032.1 arginase family protein [Actinocorallia sp. API 0066]
MSVISVPYHLDERLPAFEAPVEADETITLLLPESGHWQRMAVLYDTVADTVAKAVSEGDRPVVVSGDCTTSLGVVAGLQRAGVQPSIVWFDAHGDVHTPRSSLSGYLGGMPLRLLVGAHPEVIADLLGLAPVPEASVTLVDGRDLDPPEAEYLETAEITRCSVDELVLPDGPIYLHVDFDVIDCEELPGLLFPVPGGPSRKKVAKAIRKVLETGRVVAVGGACTWHAGHGSAAVAGPVLAPVFATEAVVEAVPEAVS